MFTKFAATRPAWLNPLWLLAAIGSAIALSACSKSIDVAQTQIVNGLVYKLNDSDPFTGEVKNASSLAISREAEQGACVLHYKAGRLHGNVICQGENGKKILEQEWDQGQKEGTEKIWDAATGNLHIEEHWKAGKRDGLFELYNPLIGKRVVRNEYKNGQVEGEQKIWDAKTGEVLLVDMVWHNGLQTGVSKLRETEETYKDGKLNGAKRHYAMTDPQYIAAASEADRVVERVRGGGWFAAQLPGTKVDQEEVYENGFRTSTSEKKSMSLRECNDLYLWGHRRKVGDDAIVTADQLAEWDGWCKQGKFPPY
jgi:antitoxin component YwqK of YwqJK toxin-antitoxin module